MAWIKTYIFWAMMCQIACGKNQIENTKITEINHAGIIFERATSVRMVEDSWKIDIGIDTSNIRRNLNDMENATERSREAIAKKRSRAERMGKRYLKLIMEEEQEYMPRLLELIKETQEGLKNLHAAQKSCKYNSIPEHELIIFEERFRFMFSKQNNLLMESEQKRTIINSWLSTFENYTEIHAEINERLWEEDISSLDERRAHAPGLTLIEQLTKKLTSRGKVILEVAEKADNGRLMPWIIRREQWKHITEIINKRNSPLAINEIDLDKFATNVTMTCGATENLLIISIKVPLSINENFTLYEMHALPIAQRTRSETAAAFIQPSEPYILIGPDRYYMIKTPYLSLCNKFDTDLYCPLEWLTSQRDKNCEYLLLTKSRNIDLTHCNIRYTNTFAPTIIKLNSVNGWLYSTPVPETLTIRCDKENAAALNVRGIGMIKFNSTCRVTFPGKIVYSKTQPTIENSEQPEIIMPQTQLNIESLTDIFSKKETLKCFHDLTLLEEERSFWDVESTCKLNKGGINAMTPSEKLKSEIIIYTLSITIMIVLLIVGGILTFMCYFKRVLDDTPDEIELQLKRFCEDETEQPERVELTRTGVIRFK